MTRDRKGVRIEVGVIVCFTLCHSGVELPLQETRFVLLHGVVDQSVGHDEGHGVQLYLREDRYVNFFTPRHGVVDLQPKTHDEGEEEYVHVVVYVAHCLITFMVHIVESELMPYRSKGRTRCGPPRPCVDEATTGHIHFPFLILGIFFLGLRLLGI